MEDVFGPRHFFSHRARSGIFFYLYNDTIRSIELPCPRHFFQLKFDPGFLFQTSRRNGRSRKATISIFYYIPKKLSSSLSIAEKLNVFPYSIKRYK